MRRIDYRARAEARWAVSSNAVAGCDCKHILMKILIVHYHSFELWHAPLWIRERLQQEFPQHQFMQLQNDDRVPEEIGDTDVFIGWSLRPQQFLAAKKLRWIHSPAAAVHQLMYPELIQSNVVLTNSTGIHGPVVAEHAMAVLLAMAKRLPQAMQYQAKHEWSQDQLWHGQPRPREVAEATVARHRHGRHWARVRRTRQGFWDEGLGSPRKSSQGP